MDNTIPIQDWSENLQHSSGQIMQNYQLFEHKSLMICFKYTATFHSLTPIWIPPLSFQTSLSVWFFLNLPSTVSCLSSFRDPNLAGPFFVRRNLRVAGCFSFHMKTWHFNWWDQFDLDMIFCYVSYIYSHNWNINSQLRKTMGLKNSPIFICSLKPLAVSPGYLVKNRSHLIRQKIHVRLSTLKVLRFCWRFVDDKCVDIEYICIYYC